LANKDYLLERIIDIMKKFSPYMTEILTEMCRRVGTTMDQVDWDDKEWYRAYEWSEEEQAKFQGWLVNYFYNNSKARRSMTTCHKHKGRLLMAAKEFTFMYGWKFK
jgi:hypothetical protein